VAQSKVKRVRKTVMLWHWSTEGKCRKSEILREMCEIGVLSDCANGQL
jgi:hypothetical protein